ncbi:MAG TPA: hypothetical protein VIU15_39760 [Streptomyces sp.]
MSIRHVVEHALLSYYGDSADPDALVGEVLAQYTAECEAAVLRRAADAISVLPQDYECDPGRGDAVERLRATAAGIEAEVKEKSSPTGADATPTRADHLLDTIRAQGGRWTTGRVQAHRRSTGGPTQRGTASRDLDELYRRGHLQRCGAQDGRFYVLRKDGDR